MMKDENLVENPEIVEMIRLTPEATINRDCERPPQRKKEKRSLVSLIGDAIGILLLLIAPFLIASLMDSLPFLLGLSWGLGYVWGSESYVAKRDGRRNIIELWKNLDRISKRYAFRFYFSYVVLLTLLWIPFMVFS